MTLLRLGSKKPMAASWSILPCLLLPSPSLGSLTLGEASCHTASRLEEVSTQGDQEQWTAAQSPWDLKL